MLDPETGMDVALPPSRTLKADLAAPKWQMTARGIQVEGKFSECKDGFGDIKSRLGRSPDEGDAVVLAAREAKIKVVKNFKQGPVKANGNYNPQKFMKGRR